MRLQWFNSLTCNSMSRYQGSLNSPQRSAALSAPFFSASLAHSAAIFTSASGP